MNSNFNYFVLGLIILIFVIILLLIFKKILQITSQNNKKNNNNEKFLSEEAIENISSLYNKQNLTVSNLNVTNGFNLLPKGIIVAWTGSTPPSGWLLCNGLNGTPDLRGRFILGDGKGTNLSNRSIGQTGGEEQHVLNVNEMPSHTHGFAVGGGGGNNNSGIGTDQGYSVQWVHFQEYTQSTGGNFGHNNMPPYYVLAYLMKT